MHLGIFQRLYYSIDVGNLAYAYKVMIEIEIGKVSSKLLRLIS